MRHGISRVSVPMQLALYFALNPTEELRTDDIIHKFGTDRTTNEGITKTLRSWIAAGYFTKTKVPGCHYERYSTYCAGPEILRLIPNTHPHVTPNWDKPLARRAA